MVIILTRGSQQTSVFSQSKSHFIVVIERCISSLWWLLSLENCFSAWNITHFLPSPTPNEQVGSFILCQPYNLLLFPPGSPLSQVFQRQWFDSLSNVYINKICQSNPIWALCDCLPSLWSPNTWNVIPLLSTDLVKQKHLRAAVSPDPSVLTTFTQKI